MNVLWTKTALEHLVAIYEHIARDSPRYALRMVDRITRRSQQIGAYPRSGREVPESGSPDIREIVEAPFRIIYQIRGDAVHVLAVIHSARLLPNDSSFERD